MQMDNTCSTIHVLQYRSAEGCEGHLYIQCMYIYMYVHTGTYWPLGLICSYLNTKKMHDLGCCVCAENVSDGCFLCEGPCDILFQPCGHTAMCAVCAEPVIRCPTCRVSCKILYKV